MVVTTVDNDRHRQEHTKSKRVLRVIQPCSTSAALASKATAGNTERSNGEPSREMSFVWLQNTFLKVTSRRCLDRFVVVVWSSYVVAVMVVVVEALVVVVIVV